MEEKQDANVKLYYKESEKKSYNILMLSFHTGESSDSLKWVSLNQICFLDMTYPSHEHLYFTC